MVIRQRNGVLTPAIDILGVNVERALSGILCCRRQSLASGIWGYGATVALGNDEPSTLIMGLGLLSRRGLIHTQKEG